MLSDIHLGQLHRSDGSSTCSAYGCKVVASVNGPVEVTRRDELPEEATVEVNVRPISGVGGIRERHFEAILHKVLRQVIRVKDHPRALIQITLQISSWSETKGWSGRPVQAASNLRAVPVLLNAATLALLSTAIPLNTVPSAVLIGTDAGGLPQPVSSTGDIKDMASLHVLAFALDGKLLLAESEGNFSLQAWQAVVEAAKESCVSSDDDLNDSSQVRHIRHTLQDVIRATVLSNSLT